MKRSGFTLVELAIVMTIIGLLIGGILKGQELLQNARIKATAAQMKSYAAATITFRDVYNSYPGDIVNPGNFLPGCSTAPCNMSGNADNEIGPVYAGAMPWYNDENNNFWVHLAKANLISGIDPNSTWTAPAYFLASLPDNKMGGKITVVSYSHNTGPYVQGLRGAYIYMFKPTADGENGGRSIPVSTFFKYDTKFDDGKPWIGAAVLDSTGCGLSPSVTEYDPNLNAICSYDVKLEI